MAKWLPRSVLGSVVALCLGWTAPAAQAQHCRDACTRDGCCPAEPAPGTTPSTDFDPALAPVASAALPGSLASFGPGYLDNALPFTHLRLRYDSAYDNNRPDRAEYFYAKCGCFQTPDAKGPPLGETSVDFQDVTAYLEYAPSPMFSVFAEFPYRFLNPDNNANASGYADMNAGFKVALLYNRCRILSFLGRAYFPTGDSVRGLGTDHVSLEAELLYSENLTDRLTVFGQFGEWFPIDGSDFAGNILRYGAGASYTVIDNGRFRAAPVVELMGWTVLNGQEFAFPENTVQDATGDTIVNAKVGVRFSLGSSDLYMGYGRALTGDVWSQDILRLEYRLRF
jgi:hypothetical protein